MSNTYVVVMAGGVGTRFWPFSRTHFPKQFHDVLGTGRTLLQQTVDRFKGICPIENVYVVTSTEYKDLVNQQLPALKDDQILLEPYRRNTGPCAAYASYKIAVKDPEAVIVVAPADHIIQKDDEFRTTITTAIDAARKDDILVTLGITPHRPDTGYGYIQYTLGDGPIKKVKTFTEKPHFDLAVKFLESGDFVWNAGIFAWKAKTLKGAVKKHLPDIAEIFEEGEKDFYTSREKGFISRAYSHCKNISIDNGIMEKASNVYVVLSDFGWSDLGTWKSLYEISDKDENHNVVNGRLILHDAKDNIIKMPKEKLVVINGLEGFIVAEYDNILLICRKDDEQKVKEFVAEAKELNSKYS